MQAVALTQTYAATSLRQDMERVEAQGSSLGFRIGLGSRVSGLGLGFRV